MNIIKRALMKWAIGQIYKQNKSVTSSQLLPNNQNNKAIFVDYETGDAITDGYKVSSYVYICVNKLMKSAASVPWQVFKKTKNEMQRIEDHPLEQLMRRPNPYITGQDMMERVTSHLYLGGNALLSKIKVSNTTVELWPLFPDNIKPVPNKTDFIKHYEVKINGKVVSTILPEDLIHIMFIDPSTTYWGIGPFQAASKTIDTDVEAVNWNKVSLQNRCIADGVFSFDEYMTDDQWEEAREKIREQHQGSDNARTPWVLGAGAKWQQMY